MANRYYWDSVVFIKLISNLQTSQAIDDRRNCELFFRDAMEGKIEILTSTLTLIEVREVEESKGQRPIPTEVREKIEDLFDEPYITLIPLDLERGKEARELRYSHTWLQTADAVHIASATFAKVDAMHTYDGRGRRRGILSLDNLIGNPPLRIRIPSYEGPITLDEALRK